MAEKAKKVASPTVGGPSPKAALRETELSIGNNRSADYKPVKTSGIVVRGGKAQTKGKMARGPMA